ncbi:MAG: DUF2461 domain-containing protein [Bryobacteraceae bacterium]|jgi:uncharacterized protein (TIGR02453 family)
MARSGFAGFPAEAMGFFRGLARNNHRDWFLPRKAVFEQSVKQPMRELVAALNHALAGFAPEYATDPEKAIFRIYRDVRFSKDKKPYKEHIAASFPLRGGMAHGHGGFYLSVSHKEVAVGGGVYMPEPAALLAIRNHIAEHHAELRRVLKNAKVRRLLGELQGEQLARVPKGFCADHPAADLLRFKQFVLYVELPPGVATSPTLYREIVDRFRAMVPFLRFLNAPLPKEKKIDARDLLG